MHNLIFISRTQLNAKIWSYNFQINEPLAFVLGQYARLRFPFDIANPNGKQQRKFTIIS